ncbi:hypothetical protein cyc_07132 [Cyclospora cayetanensis]|uniref:Uncharacterized protein n=1 Tax=Cyclospora cayetanensis TaxID=88456 RepID=A0A1D3D4P7_9EIME|nr:hypothetical protein cyc_07132 [Cyclospora cayetanensis]
MAPSAAEPVAGHDFQPQELQESAVEPWRCPAASTPRQQLLQPVPVAAFTADAPFRAAAAETAFAASGVLLRENVQLTKRLRQEEEQELPGVTMAFSRRAVNGCSRHRDAAPALHASPAFGGEGRAPAAAYNDAS